MSRIVPSVLGPGVQHLSARRIGHLIQCLVCAVPRRESGQLRGSLDEFGAMLGATQPRFVQDLPRLSGDLGHGGRHGRIVHHLVNTVLA